MDDWKEFNLNKILDRRIDLTEEQFIDYLNKTFMFKGPSKLNQFFQFSDVEEDGTFLKGFFRLAKIEQDEHLLANSYYLFLNTGKFDIFGSLKSDSVDIEEGIGRLNVLNTGSLPPWYTLIVNNDYSFFIELFLKRMFNDLHLQFPDQKTGESPTQIEGTLSRAIENRPKPGRLALPHIEEAYEIYIEKMSKIEKFDPENSIKLLEDVFREWKKLKSPEKDYSNKSINKSSSEWQQFRKGITYRVDRDKKAYKDSKTLMK